MSGTRSERSARSSRSPDIEVIGADANNLRHIDVTLPLNAVSVVTGVSGSGKSSLLAETLAAKGSGERGRSWKWRRTSSPEITSARS